MISRVLGFVLVALIASCSFAVSSLAASSRGQVQSPASPEQDASSLVEQLPDAVKLDADVVKLLASH